MICHKSVKKRVDHIVYTISCKNKLKQIWIMLSFLILIK